MIMTLTTCLLVVSSTDATLRIGLQMRCADYTCVSFGNPRRVLQAGSPKYPATQWLPVHAMQSIVLRLAVVSAAIRPRLATPRHSVEVGITTREEANTLSWPRSLLCGHCGKVERVKQARREKALICLYLDTTDGDNVAD